MDRVTDAYERLDTLLENRRYLVGDRFSRADPVVIEAPHGYMTTRGVHQHDVEMVTSPMIGVFRDQPETRQPAVASTKR